MDTLAKKFKEKFTEIYGFMPNTAFGNNPTIVPLYQNKKRKQQKKEKTREIAPNGKLLASSRLMTRES